MSKNKSNTNNYPKLRAAWMTFKIIGTIAVTAYIAWLQTQVPTDGDTVQASAISIIPTTAVDAAPAKPAFLIDEEAPRLYPGNVRCLTGHNVFAGNQLNADDFAFFLQKSGVKTVIRLNTEKRGEKILSRTKEGSLCGNNVRYIEFNIEGKHNQCNEKMLLKIDQLMDEGNVFVHCTDGVYRSMLVAARHEARHTSDDWATIADRVGWTEDRLNDSQYWRYYRSAWDHLNTQGRPAK